MAECKNGAFNKYKQLVLNSSPELKDFERKLQTAYNQKMLEAQIAQSKISKSKQVVEERELIYVENKRTSMENERLLHEMNCKRHQEKVALQILQQQIDAKRRNEHEEHQKSVQERLKLEVELQNEEAERLRIDMEKEAAKIKTRKHQLNVLAEKREMAEKERQKEAEDEELRHEEATKLANFDISILDKRLRRIEEFEKIKEILLAQLNEINKLALKREDIRIRLNCIEKDEQARIAEEEDEKRQISRRESAKCSYDDIMLSKTLQTKAQVEEDKMYASNVAQIITGDLEREKTTKAIEKRIRTAVRIDNSKLSAFRRQQLLVEREVEKRAAEKEMADSQERDRIVREERLRLLRCLDDELIAYLPPGTLTEEDLLYLNRMPQK